MPDSSNYVLLELMNKKHSLVQHLLVESQRLLLEQNSLFQDNILLSRAKIIDQLQTTDLSISRWEEGTGKIAKEVEKGLYKDIFRIFRLISENDASCLNQLEKERQKLLRERKKLGRGTRVSGYVKQKSNFNSFRNPS